MNKDLADLLVPQEILEHFAFEGYADRSGIIQLFLTEKNDVEHIPKAIVRDGKAVLAGYMNPLELQTYPTLGKEVFLQLKRRRWKVKGSTRGYHNEYNFTRPGMKATKDFGDFLKEIGRE